MRTVWCVRGRVGNEVAAWESAKSTFAKSVMAYNLSQTIALRAFEYQIPAGSHPFPLRLSS